ncbi:MAG: M28 family metallopeptidase [Microgenomates group bacterium]
MIKLLLAIAISAYALLTLPSSINAQTSPCESKRVAGDYNCDDRINLLDFDSFRIDFVANKVSLIYFDYWRKAMFGSPPNSSTPTPANQGKQQLITQTIAAVSKQKITETVTAIADDDDVPGVDATQTRYSNSSGNQVERAYITAQLQGMGYQVTTQTFSLSGVNSANIIARLAGKDTSKYYIVTAHLDSTAALSGTNDPAPGADDNGSGTAAVLETARVLKSMGSQLTSSVEFVLFSGEEQGLYGSDYYTSRITDPSAVQGVFNMDMVGWNQPGRGECVQFGYLARNGGNILSEAAQNIDRTHNIQLKADSVLTNIMASDHGSFVRKGMKAILIAECVLMEGGRGTVQPNYHSTRDKPDTLNYAQIEKTAKTVVGTVIDLAY